MQILARINAGSQQEVWASPSITRNLFLLLFSLFFLASNYSKSFLLQDKPSVSARFHILFFAEVTRLILLLMKGMRSLWVESLIPWLTCVRLGSRLHQEPMRIAGKGFCHQMPRWPFRTNIVFLLGGGGGAAPRQPSAVTLEWIGPKRFLGSIVPPHSQDHQLSQVHKGLALLPDSGPLWGLCGLD